MLWHLSKGLSEQPRRPVPFFVGTVRRVRLRPGSALPLPVAGREPKSFRRAGLGSDPEAQAPLSLPADPRGTPGRDPRARPPSGSPPKGRPPSEAGPRPPRPPRAPPPPGPAPSPAPQTRTETATGRRRRRAGLAAQQPLPLLLVLPAAGSPPSPRLLLLLPGLRAAGEREQRAVCRSAGRTGTRRR